MTAINFGAGTVIGKRTDIANAKPSFLGILQDVEINVEQTLKELTGQYKMAVDVAPANLKVSGTAKFARIQGATINNLLLGQTETDNAGIDYAVAEQHNGSGTATTFTVSNGTSYIEDLGVFYASNGVQLQPIASTPAVGQYIPGVAGTGEYTINASDAGILLNVYYSFTVTSLVQLSMVNQQMGVGPVFELNVGEVYSVAGVPKKLNIKLNACRGSKMTFPMKNTDYTISDFEFMAFADTSNNWGTWSFTE